MNAINPKNIVPARKNEIVTIVRDISEKLVTVGKKNP